MEFKSLYSAIGILEKENRPGARSTIDYRLTRDMVVGTPSAGGFTVGTESRAQYIDALRPQSVCVMAGARYIDRLVGDISIPRMSDASTGEWIAENVATSTTTPPTLASVTMSPKCASMRVNVSRKLLLQSSPSVEEILRQSFGASLASMLDRAAIQGSGSDSQPLGILNTSGIAEIDASGSIDWQDITSIMASVESTSNNGAFAFLISPDVAEYARSTEKFSGAGAIMESDFISGRNALVSSNVPTGSLVYGDFSQLIIGSWSMEIIRNPITDDGSVNITALHYADCRIITPAAFGAVTGITG